MGQASFTSTTLTWALKRRPSSRATGPSPRPRIPSGARPPPLALCSLLLVMVVVNNSIGSGGEQRSDGVLRGVRHARQARWRWDTEARPPAGARGHRARYLWFDELTISPRYVLWPSGGGGREEAEEERFVCGQPGESKTKMEVARECVMTLVDNLHPTDSFGLVLFDTVLRSSPMPMPIAMPMHCCRARSTLHHPGGMLSSSKRHGDWSSCAEKRRRARAGNCEQAQVGRTEGHHRQDRDARRHGHGSGHQPWHVSVQGRNRWSERGRNGSSSNMFETRHVPH